MNATGRCGFSSTNFSSNTNARRLWTRPPWRSESPLSRRVKRTRVCIAGTRSLWSWEHSPFLAHPFSALPTPFQVHVETHAYYANCAWDMLGIPAALHADAQIEATYSDTNEVARLSVVDDRIDGDGAVYFSLPFRQWYDDLIDT